MSYPPEHLIKAAEAGDPDAQYELGLIYCMLGEQRKSFHWLRKARSQEHVRAKELLYAFIEKFLMC